MMTLIRRLAPMTLAAVLATAPVAQAGPFTVDDMLGTETFGAVRLSPDGRYVLYERFGPYESADRFDLSSLGLWSTSTVWIADRSSGAPPRPLLAPADGRGVILGAASPDGARLAVHRLQFDRWETGVVEVATGRVTWLGVGAEPPTKGETALWRSNKALILIVRADGDLPYEIAGLRDAERNTERRRAATRRGEAATTVWGSGAHADIVPYAAATQVVSIDVVSGRRTLLDTGQGVDMALSPSGRWLALVSRGPLNPVDPAMAFRAIEQGEQRRLTLLDLDTGARWSPLPDADLAAGLLGWSPVSDRVLVWARARSRVATEGRLIAADPLARTLETFETAGLEPDVGADQDALFKTVRADWWRDHPLLLARRPGDARLDWYSLRRRGPVNLTADVPSGAGALEALLDEGLLLMSGGTVWAIDPTGRARRRETPTPVTPVSALTHWASPRLRLNAPPRRDWMLARGADNTLWRVFARRPAQALAGPADGRSALVAAGADAAVERVYDGGAETLRLRASGRPDRSLARLNPALASAPFARPLAVTQPGPSGPPVVSWLYAPPGGLRPKTPLIVVAYPGAPARVPDNPAEFNAMANVQLLAGLGYAVLVPTLPRPGTPGPAEGPADGLAEQVVAGLDAALAQYPDLDGARVGYLGHSFGGYTGLMLAGRTDRFKSFVILSAAADPAASWGVFSGFGRANAEFGISSRRNAGWAETGQGAMGGPPWTVPDVYRRNSALYQADRITAPVLLVHGELDFVPISQAETMFTALWRQNKDAQLVTYWGEHHIFYSPGTIRDLWRRIDLWFAGTLGVSPARLKPLPGDLPTGEPMPPQTLQPESPPRRPSSARHRSEGSPRAPDDR